MTSNNSTTVCARHLIDLTPATAEWCKGELFCADCDTEQSFSDLYKDEVGCRPDISVYSIEEMRAWVDAHTTPAKEDTMSAPQMTKAELQAEIDAMVEELRGLNDSTDDCHRCGGAGYIFEYSGIDNGRCFACYFKAEVGPLAREAKMRREAAARKQQTICSANAHTDSDHEGCATLCQMGLCGGEAICPACAQRVEVRYERDEMWASHEANGAF